MTTLCIDPGKHRHGYALFSGELIECGYLGSVLPKADLLVIERPVIDGRGVPPQDIVDLAWSAGVIVGRLALPTREFTPGAWKGNVPKPVHHMRVLDALSVTERARLPRNATDRIQAAVRKMALTGRDKVAYKWEGVDALDAVALGLWFLGRIVK